MRRQAKRELGASARGVQSKYEDPEYRFAHPGYAHLVFE
jgi:hypothetical protein